MYFTFTLDQNAVSFCGQLRHEARYNRNVIIGHGTSATFHFYEGFIGLNWSIVFVIKFLNAAHRLDVGAPTAWLDGPKPAAIWAMFFANRSLSNWSSMVFLFITPGLCFRLICLITAACLASMPSPPSPASGNASISESRLATSFFDGRRRLGLFLRDFSIFETNIECLIKRLSFLLVLKSSPKLLDGVAMAFRDVGGLLVMALLALVFGRIGAYTMAVISLGYRGDVGMMPRELHTMISFDQNPNRILQCCEPARKKKEKQTENHNHVS
jgi:hypothetical protein